MEVYNIWLSMCLGVAIKNAQDIIKIDLSPKEIFENKENLEKHSVFTENQLQNLKNINLNHAQNILKIHNENNIKSINYKDENYPDNLKELIDMPLVLFYKGDINLINNKNIVGIIGTRKPDRNGIKLAEEIASELSQKGAVILSGLAQGIDSLSQKAALEKNKKVIGVVGLPLNEYYPKANRNLQEDIAKNGLVISEVAATQNIIDNKYIFVQRNRLIAAIGKALVLIQAKIPSGTATTINFAIELGKEVFTVPGSVFDEMMEFNNHLLSEGIVRCTIKAKNILDVLDIKKEDIQKPEKNENLSELEIKILNEIGDKTLTANQLFQNLKIPMPVLKAMLTKLEMDGLVKQQSFGVYYKL